MKKRSYYNCFRLDYKKFNEENIKKILSRFGIPNKLKILCISTYDPNYVRTETIIQLFKRIKIKFKTILVGNKKLKYLYAIYSLIKEQRNYDIIFVAFRGHEILPFIKLFSKKPIIFDAFVSIYDTLCFDRKMFSPNSPIGRFLKWYDKFLCKISDVVILDTKSHKEYFEKEFGAKNIDYFYLGCDENLFKPMKVQKRKNRLIVFWYGKANPLQGVDVILNAAKLLEDKKDIKFRLIGPVRKRYKKLIKKLKLKNIEFVDYILYEKLPLEINKANLCLGGHFSNIDKGKRVIAGKTFQFLACKKPTIIGDNSANRELFKKAGLLHFVKINDEKSLVNKILEIRK